MYTNTIKLNNNEAPAKINLETGEVSLITQRKNNIPDGKILVPSGDFSKINIKALSFLETVLSNIELGIIVKMIRRADYNSNIMIPLNDNTSIREIAAEFNIGVNQVDKTFKKLFDLGVYAQVRVANGIHSEYWTLNPYISFKGKLINDSIYNYFNKTIIANQCKV